MTAAYKLKVLKSKFSEDPLHRRIYFLTFIESFQIIFSQYKETYMVLVDYPDTGGEDIKYRVKKTMRNLIHKNVGVHSKNLIYEFPGDGVKFISKLQYHCENTTFAYKSIYDRLLKQVTHEVVKSEINDIKIFQNAQALSVSVANIYIEDYLMNIFLDNFHQGG